MAVSNGHAPLHGVPPSAVRDVQEGALVARAVLARQLQLGSCWTFAPPRAPGAGRRQAAYSNPWPKMRSGEMPSVATEFLPRSVGTTSDVFG